MMMRLGFLVWSLMKVPLWQADTTTTVGSAPQPAVSARSNAAGLNRRSSGRRKKPRCSPWLVTKTKQASPPSVLSALRTLVDDDRRAPSLASSSLMSLTPSAARRSCNVSTPLAKAGLLLSPATSKACQRLAGMAPLAGSGAAEAGNVGHAPRMEPADLAIGDQRLDAQAAVAHDIDAHEGCELGARIVARRRHRLLADPLQLGLRRGDDVV